MGKYMRKTWSKWTSVAIQGAVMAIKGKDFLIRRAIESFSVHFSCIQRRFRDTQMNKCWTECGAPVVPSSDQEKQLIGSIRKL